MKINENHENLRKRCCHGPRSGINLFANRPPKFEKSVPEKMRWKDSAASGDEYNFISTQACELSSESSVEGRQGAVEYHPADQKIAKINENQ